MFIRRNFIHRSSLAGIMLTISESFFFLTKERDSFSYISDYLKIELSKDRPKFSFFFKNSLGKKQFLKSPLIKAEDKPGKGYKIQTTTNSIAWLFKQTPVWERKMPLRKLLFALVINQELNPIHLIFFFTKGQSGTEKGGVKIK